MGWAWHGFAQHIDDDEWSVLGLKHGMGWGEGACMWLWGLEC